MLEDDRGRTGRPACPRWQRFLDQVTAGDQDLQRFLRRIAGYGLTGSTREHALFFFYGTGANGKGTFLNTLTAILGDYAKVAGMDTFTESHTDRHPTELAMLRGARIVAAQETEEGRRWAESRIKALTGGDPITARFMRQDFFTYTPQFKLLIAGNHKPGLRNIDEAIRRRFHLLPFTVRIPPEAARSEPVRQAEGGVAGDPRLGAAGLPRMAGGGAEPAGRGDRGDRRVLRRRGQLRPLARRVLRPRSDGARDDARSLRRLDGVGGALGHVGRQRAQVPRRAEGARLRVQARCQD